MCEWSGNSRFLSALFPLVVWIGAIHGENAVMIPSNTAVGRLSKAGCYEGGKADATVDVAPPQRGQSENAEGKCREVSEDVDPMTGTVAVHKFGLHELGLLCQLACHPAARRRGCARSRSLAREHLTYILNSNERDIPGRVTGNGQKSYGYRIGAWALNATAYRCACGWFHDRRLMSPSLRGLTRWRIRPARASTTHRIAAAT